jgi:integrase
MKIEDRFPNDKATIEWLKSQKPSTLIAHKRGWKLFLTFTGLTGDQILVDRENDKEAKWEKKVLEFKSWVLSQKTRTGEPYGEGSARTFTIAVRSFFGYYRKDLKFRTQEASKLKRASPKREDYRYTRENLADMANLADLQGKYVVVAGKSFGLRIGDFLNLKRGDFEPYLKLAPPISIGEIPTQKEGVKASPFVDSDALPIIKAMINKMDREGRTAPEEKMLRVCEVEVNNIMRKLTASAGIVTGTKRVRFHCLRKFLCDRLASYMSESKWKQVVGKQIDEKSYVSTELLREPYQRAMADTTFTKGGEDVELLAAKKFMEYTARMAQIPENIKSQIMRQIKDAKTPGELEKLEEEIKKQAQQPIGGGLNFEQRAEEALAKIILGALKKVKEDQA